MTLTTTLRWRCLGIAAAGVVLLAGCSSGGSAAPAAHVSTASATGVAALGRALGQTKALRSYAFTATQRLTGGAAPQLTTLTGRAIRPAAITYAVTIAGKQQQVIKVGGHAFVRLPPAGWKALAKSSSTADPLASLLSLLREATDPQLSGNTLTARVSAAALSRAKLAPAGGSSISFSTVVFSLDPAGRVSAVHLSVTAKAGTQTLTLDERTTFSRFNAAPAITAPGTIAK